MPDDRKWRRVAETIAADIRSGHLPIGTRLPAGVDLGHVHDVDANTARVATRYLRDLGVLRSVPGSGMFVATMPPDVLPERVRVSALERRINARLDELTARVERLEQNHPGE